MSPGEPLREPGSVNTISLKLLALLLGIMAWYLIQDAIRVDTVRRQAAAEPRLDPPAGLATRRLDRLPIHVLAPPGARDWRVAPATASVWLEGHPADVARVDRSGVRPTASVWLEGHPADVARVDRSGVRLFVDGALLTDSAGESVMLPVRTHVTPDARVKAQAEPMLVEVSVRHPEKGEGP